MPQIPGRSLARGTIDHAINNQVRIFSRNDDDDDDDPHVHLNLHMLDRVELNSLNEYRAKFRRPGITHFVLIPLRVVEYINLRHELHELLSRLGRVMRTVSFQSFDIDRSKLLLLE